MRDRIRVGIGSATSGASAGKSFDGYRARERAGFDHIVWHDHISFHDGTGFDGLIEATRILSVTERIAAYGAIYLLPLRHPVPVARQLADLAAFAPDRLIFGIGVGGEDRHEVEICGVDPATRGRRTDECLAILRGLMDGKPFDFAGEFFQLEAAQILPACNPTIPIIVGGRSDAALVRTGRFGDGWLGIWCSTRRFAEAAERIAAEAEAADRGAIAWQHGLQVWLGVGDSEAEARRHVAAGMEGIYKVGFEKFERYVPYGSPERIAEFCQGYVEAGCRTFNLLPCHPDDAYAIAACAEVRRLLAGG